MLSWAVTKLFLVHKILEMARKADTSQYNLSRLLEGEENHQIGIALQQWLDGFPTNYLVNSTMAELFG